MPRRRERRRRYERYVKGIRERIKETFTRNLRKLKEDVKFRIVGTFYLRREETRRLLAKRYEQTLNVIRERIYMEKARRYVKRRVESSVDVLYWTHYFEMLNTLIDHVETISRAGLAGLTPDAPAIAKQFAHDYTTVLNATDHHFTMNAVKITDLTYQFLENKRADMFTAYEFDMKHLTNPYGLLSSIKRMLAEFLLYLLKTKGRRKKERGKSKGSYVPINYDTKIHTIHDLNRKGIITMRLGSILGNSYAYNRDKAMSLGKPELANRIDFLGVFAIIGRKTKTTKLESYYAKPSVVTERLRNKFAFYKKW